MWEIKALPTSKTLGDFSGGVLHYFPEDDGLTPLEELEDKDSEEIDTSKLAWFNGNKAHGVTPFSGER